MHSVSGNKVDSWLGIATEISWHLFSSVLYSSYTHDYRVWRWAKINNLLDRQRMANERCRRLKPAVCMITPLPLTIIGTEISIVAGILCFGYFFSCACTLAFIFFRQV